MFSLFFSWWLVDIFWMQLDDFRTGCWWFGVGC